MWTASARRAISPAEYQFRIGGQWAPVDPRIRRPSPSIASFGPRLGLSNASPAPQGRAPRSEIKMRSKAVYTRKAIAERHALREFRLPRQG
jgi:hypothetical protein